MPETDYPPELQGRNVLQLDQRALQLWQLGYWDGRASREPELEALRVERDDLFRLAFDRSLRGSYSELMKLRARRLWDVGYERTEAAA